MDVIFPNIQADSMYMLYYVTASEYPLRPVSDNSVQSDTVVTFVWSPQLTLCWLLAALLLLSL